MAFTAFAPAADWIDITPVSSLAGWTRAPIPGASVIEPYNQWALSDGVLICKGDGNREWLRYDQELADFILQVEWKAVARDGTYNSGVGVRMSPFVEIWHQAQTKPEGGFLFGNSFKDGSIQRMTLVKEMTENRVKPAGEWNTYEIRCEGPTISLSVNGAVVNVWKDNQVRKGHVGLEAEGYEMHFRNVKVRKLD
jgi:hypothetical protein